MIPEHLREVGEVKHYYTNLGVAVVDIKDVIHKGDKIVIAGTTSNFRQKAESLELEHHRIKEAHAGDSIGLKVWNHARPHDKVYVVL